MSLVYNPTEEKDNKLITFAKSVYFYFGCIVIATLIPWNIWVYQFLSSGRDREGFTLFLFIIPVSLILYLSSPVFVPAIVGVLKERMQNMAPSFPPVWLFLLNIFSFSLLIITTYVNLTYWGDLQNPYFIMFGPHSFFLVGAFVIATLSANKEYKRLRSGLA